MLKFYIDNDQEEKLNLWLEKIKNKPKAKKEPLKYIFYSVAGIGQIQEVSKGPFKLDLTNIDDW